MPSLLDNLLSSIIDVQTPTPCQFRIRDSLIRATTIRPLRDGQHTFALANEREVECVDRHCVFLNVALILELKNM